MEEKTDIQKLKDLFVEYHWEWVYGIIEPEHWIYLREAMQARAPYIISRKYWFIRWLIKRHKIDRDKFDEKRDECNKDLRIAWVDDYELLLMLLAIQTEPIDFLSSILM